MIEIAEWMYIWEDYTTLNTYTKLCLFTESTATTPPTTTGTIIG